MSDYNVKKGGHPILAVVLGVIGIIIALLLTMFFGVIAGGAALLLGVIAILLGFSARKKSGQGLGGIIAGALAAVLAIVMTVSSINAFGAIKKEAAKYNDVAPLVVKSLDNTYLGILGMFVNMPQDEGTLQELVDQYKVLDEIINKGNDSGAAAPAATDAPAAEEAPAEETPAEEAAN